MRLFVALNLPDAERQRIHSVAATLRNAGFPVRWVSAESLHITMKFLGEVRHDRVGSVVGAVEAAASKTPAFDLGLGGFGAFPALRRPRVIWLGAEATPELRCLKHDLEWGLGELGFAREVRAFAPHVTLGRAHASSGAGDFRRLQELFEAIEYAATVRVDTVDLMRSTL
ncbi:MAG TPA: RNA 2',3'-cyclic phosphodiesterase, partial [Longimicrobiales bacterium]|nr:RNA 2',3'-cyclic phosphodiesterase [Longimicrobiales bacterium]